MTMKRHLALTGLLLAVCALAEAQDTADRVVAPARNTGVPRVIEISLMRANITVKTHAGTDVIVEAPGAGQTTSDRTASGMHRIDTPPYAGVRVQEQDNVLRVQVPMHNGRQRDLTLTVPVETSLSLKTVMGDISVEGVHGETDVTTTHGRVTLTDVSGTVVASSSMGSLKVSMDRLDPAKPLSFSSFNGNVDVTFPADVKANLKFRTDHGEIWSDFDVAISGRQTGGMHPLVTNGVYRAGADRNLYGTINGGGVEVSFRTYNGKILIHKKK
jgi:hypothetical protein